MKSLTNLVKELQETDMYYALIFVKVYNDFPETIIINSCGFKNKAEYYKNAYTEDLKLKTNENIQIIHYDFTQDLSEYYKFKG